MGPLVRWLLARTGVLAILREQWRNDQAAMAAKVARQVERRTDRHLSAMNTRLNRASEAMGGHEPTHAPAASAAILERLTRIEREVTILHATVAQNALHRVRRHGPLTFDPAAVHAHAAGAIARATVADDPMPHLVVEGLLPEDTYQAMLDAIPPSIFFSQHDRKKQNLKVVDLAVAPDFTLKALGFLEEEIIPVGMVPALLRQFEAHIRTTYDTTYGPTTAASAAALPHVATRGRLMLRRPGYRLEPHLDPRRVIVTCLIYFARPGDSETYGTSFYRINGVPVIDRTNTFFPSQQGLTCDLVRTVPFRPNTAVAFLNFGAAHGAGIPRSAPENTERYAYQFYISPEAGALAALTGEADADADADA